ncbi:C45 family autoproteolytic acyltransferase/hydolase [Plantactinospora endophytica]|uniref:Peptidase C45 n=1 Tax=Plantactinospora endophytica TaxID=673535 RepID=A0ABQ4E899_9ACTN|nr:C45 family peptidase [Plantactinospora endophytica]GIG90945.1 peptidase C45 [Plantactinospora endophytica]
MTSARRLDQSDLPVPLIRVQGTPAECGTGYGAAARDLITANLEFYLRRFRAEGGLDGAAVVDAGRAFREATRRHHPRVAELLDGVAEGAEARVEEIYALNARTELIYGRHRDRTPAASPDAGAPVRPDAGTAVPPGAGNAGPPDAGAGACTTVGVLGTHTGNGHLLLGQNWDWHPDQRAVMLLLATRDERGLTVLTLTEAGMVAKTGLNSAGVGVCVNMLGCDRDGLPGPGVEPGVPYHVLLRAALEADSLAEALKAVLRGTRNSSINLLMGQAAEAGGELIDLELVPGDAGWLHPVDGYLTHANHLETALPVYDTIKDWGGSSLFRSARARRLLAPKAAVGKVGDGDLAALFRDHASFPQSICRHVDERMPPAERSETVYSVLLDLDDRRLGIAAGPPCEHRYGWLDLSARRGA